MYFMFVYACNLATASAPNCLTGIITISCGGVKNSNTAIIASIFNTISNGYLRIYNLNTFIFILHNCYMKSYSNYKVNDQIIDIIIIIYLFIYYL